MKYREHEKLKKVIDKSQAVGAFLDWLTHSQGCVIAEYRGSELFPIYMSIEKLLAAYFNIDTRKLEHEKEQMLKELRKDQRKAHG